MGDDTTGTDAIHDQGRQSSATRQSPKLEALFNNIGTLPPFDNSLDGFNPCLPTRRRLIDFVKSPNLLKISTSIVVNTGTLVTMNPQLLVSLELGELRSLPFVEAQIPICREALAIHLAV